MTYDVIVTEQADADLRGIYEYIAFELLSPDNASPGAGSTYFVSCHSTDALNKSLATVYSEWGKNSYARRISFRDAKFK